MEKFLIKSIDIARELFVPAYNNSSRYQSFHFCCAWDKNRLLSIGQNRIDRPSAKAIYFANKFKVEKSRKYPFIHAEIDCISRIWGKHYIDNKTKLVVIRINSYGELQNSKPCSSCMTVLRPIGVRIWHSTSDGKVVRI